MKTGLLWFDDDPRKESGEKVSKAVTYYEHKHGHPPNMCFVHSSVLGNDGKQPVRKVGDLNIRTGRSVLPSHFWLGVIEDTRTRK
ncbi:MAG: hypothetical protein SXV54_05535 [Chloroflexota bacterium]|nr:hypothetical protein [Chloroflexota bacterium]